MTEPVDNRDDAVARLRAVGGESVDPVVSWIDEREWLIRKKDVDFATIVEASSQIAAKSLDLGKIEAYSMTMLMGQFGYLRAFFMRPVEFSQTQVQVVGKSKNLPKLSFEIDSALGHHLREAAQPLDMEPLAEIFAQLVPLRDFGVEAVLPLVITDRIHGDSLKGCICVGQRIGGRALKDEERRLLSLLANLIAVSVHNAQLYHDSIVDGLTQVFGRGHFDMRLRDEISRVERRLRSADESSDKGVKSESKPDSVSLVLLDIDHFKHVNDNHGHQTGDMVLQRVARYLSDNVRQVDVVARYGGEEFTLILPEASKQDALTLTERLRIGLHQLRIGGEKSDLQITASFGVATYPEDAKSERDLLALADRAMYRAKAQGRNRVCGATRASQAEDVPPGEDGPANPTQQGVHDGA